MKIETDGDIIHICFEYELNMRFNIRKDGYRMKPSIFAKWLKGVIIGTTCIGLISCIYAIPMMLDYFSLQYPEASGWILPWKLLIYICSVPCFVAMIICWRIAGNIQRDRSFCKENAVLFKWFSYLAIGDALVFMLGCIIFFLLGMNHPGLLIIEMLIVFAGLAVFVCTAALSYLVAQAADLKEDNDLTI